MHAHLSFFGPTVSPYLDSIPTAGIACVRLPRPAGRQGAAQSSMGGMDTRSSSIGSVKGIGGMSSAGSVCHMGCIRSPGSDGRAGVEVSGRGCCSVDDWAAVLPSRGLASRDRSPRQELAAVPAHQQQKECSSATMLGWMAAQMHIRVGQLERTSCRWPAK
eukprot:scaffold287883_cov18-Tisochrysis_lutea.AAC.2